VDDEPAKVSSFIFLDNLRIGDHLRCATPDQPVSWTGAGWIPGR
jgi:hypothetical protein